MRAGSCSISVSSSSSTRQESVCSMHLNARSKSNGGRLHIAKARAPQVQRVIELTGAGDELPFLD